MGGKRVLAHVHSFELPCTVCSDESMYDSILYALNISRHCNQYAFIVTACSQTHADLQEAFEQPLIYVHVLLGAQVLSNSVVNLVE